MDNPVIVIGLDSASPQLIEAWMLRGGLKNLARLRAQGGYGRIRSMEHLNEEAVWATFTTGCYPQQTGHWEGRSFNPKTYTVEWTGAYNFQEYKPFYSLGDRYRVAVFDLPQVRIDRETSGLQMLSWGACSPQAPNSSQPSHLWEEIVDKFGIHPLHRKNHLFDSLNLTRLEQLQHLMKSGISCRTDICHDLLGRESWDLFLTIYSEPHIAGHFMWHLSQKNHPLYEVLGVKAKDDGLRCTYEAIDQSIGQILTKIPDDAYIVIFSAHGMDANITDIPSMAILAEFLYRFNFPGRKGLHSGHQNQDIPPPITQLKNDSYKEEVWSYKFENNPLQRIFRQKLPPSPFDRLNLLLGRAPIPDLVSPSHLKKQAFPLAMHPVSFYSSCWPQMKAFALPGFVEGLIRINLQGREAQGIVSPENYKDLCDELREGLYQLKDARTGQPMVREVIQLRPSPHDSDLKLPNADLLVDWQPVVTDTIDSPEYGRMGPFPYRRTGGHTPDGFLMVFGPEIEAGTTFREGRVVDLAPTILRLMGAPIPDYLEGRSII